MRVRLVLFGLVLFAVVSGAVLTRADAAESFTDAQKSELGQLIRDYLVKNPEVIQEALEAAQRPGLVQAAFVATHAGYSGRHPKGAAPFFGFVPESITRNFCGLVSTHFYLLLPKYEFKGS